jgi:methyl-accepting chemotaxis protein
MWSAHERALVRMRDASSAAQRIAASAARQRGAMDAVADRARAVSSRASELQGAFSRAVDAFERLSLIALNAGLEGARLGEAEGRQLGLVSDEVRAQAARGGDATKELAAGLARLGEEVALLAGYVGDAQAGVSEVSQDASRAAGASTDAESALADVGERVRRATGSDPEAVRAIAEASERARALVDSLSSVAGKVPRALLVAALRPALEPLAALLGDDPDPPDGDR